MSAAAMAKPGGGGGGGGSGGIAAAAFVCPPDSAGRSAGLIPSLAPLCEGGVGGLRGCAGAGLRDGPLAAAPAGLGCAA